MNTPVSITPNKLGWITELSINQSYNELINVDLSITAQDPGTLVNQFTKWMREGIRAPEYKDEYTCLYCTSPNPIILTHCKQCGAPRSFVIG